MNQDVLLLREDAVHAVCRLRLALLEELGEISVEQDASALRLATAQYYLEHINRDFFTWGVISDGELAAVGSLCLFTRVPYPENLTGLEGYILNVYTAQPFRKRGLAQRILESMVEYAETRGIGRLWLHSSHQAERLYSGFGFTRKDNEMELFLTKPD